MKHIKLFESFSRLNPNDLEELLEILDFPRQTPEGYLERFGEVSLSSDIGKNDRAMRALSFIEETPSALETPEARRMMDEWAIDMIRINRGNDVVEITYKPISIQAYKDGYYEDGGLTYAEYLKNWQ
jgi:hypothetical protein